jgi:hypothetical protein
MARPFARTAESILTWPFGVGLTSWTYLWRTTPIYRRELPGSPAEDLPPPVLTHGALLERVHRVEDGAGPLFHRTYAGRILDSKWSAEALMERVSDDPNLVAPLALARFRKTAGPSWRMRVGDEFVVRMPGPWDGPIRVMDLSPTSFRFATLDGHLEAGQIEWRAGHAGDVIVFQIESWARAGDRLSALLHDRLRMAKEVQLHMWTSVVEKAVDRTDGRLERGIEIETRRVEAAQFEDPEQRSAGTLASAAVPQSAL